MTRLRSVICIIGLEGPVQLASSVIGSLKSKLGSGPSDSGDKSTPNPLKQDDPFARDLSRKLISWWASIDSRKRFKIDGIWLLPAQFANEGQGYGSGEFGMPVTT